MSKNRKELHGMAKADVAWEVDEFDHERGKRMVLRCKNHGVTDDMVLVEYGNTQAKYICRRCLTTPCPEHGHDYTTVLSGRQVCIVCEPNALMDAADGRNRRRREFRKIHMFGHNQA